MRVHNFTSHVPIRAFPESTISGCPNAMSNQPKMPNRNPFLIAKFGSISVFQERLLFFSFSMYTLPSISPRLSQRTLQK